MVYMSVCARVWVFVDVCAGVSVCEPGVRACVAY